MIDINWWVLGVGLAFLLAARYGPTLYYWLMGWREVGVPQADPVFGCLACVALAAMFLYAIGMVLT